MKRLVYKFGKIVFWLSWPIFWLMLNNTERSRLLLFYDGRLLVVKDWFNYKWSLPGGGKHPNESSQEAVIREVKEELGFKLDTKTVKPLFSEKVRYKGLNVQLDYLVAQVTVKPEVKVQWLEVSNFAWLLPSELNAQNAGLDVVHGLAKILKGKFKFATMKAG